MIETDHLIYEKDGAIATMTFNRPQARNAISLELGQAMGEATADFEADEELRVLIVTGAGDVAFCSGGDLKTAIPQVTSMASQGLARPATGTSRPFSGVTKPVIAAVNGYALAGGM
ncbi:MAG TPA: enoyl-CoA hydratase/isomerase family protein, partial [Trebonia sp.]|nr:enoyl-CoA hydratase/isomerase family protein [Trebonia sp.]